jgi:hypothetical protein
MATVQTTKPSGKPVAPASQTNGQRAEQFVHAQLAKAATYVKVVELFGSLMHMLWAGLGGLLVLAIIDAWIFELPIALRTLAFLVLIGTGVFWFVKYIVPLAIYRINPAYAARSIEKRRPELKNSLINYLSMRSDARYNNSSVFQLIGMRAANDLSEVPTDDAADSKKLVRIGIVLGSVLVVCILYKVFSPIDPFQTVTRVVQPLANLARPSRITIEDVNPGDASLYFGQSLEVSATINGSLPDDQEVLLVYTTRDGQQATHSIPMTSSGRYQYRALLKTDKVGIQQSLTYYIMAGDGISKTFSVDVQPVPTVSVERIQYKYPKYTGDPDLRKVGDARIEGIEGTHASITARSNVALANAYIELLKQHDAQDSENNPKYDSVRMYQMKVAEKQLDGGFVLTLGNDRKSTEYTHYRFSFLPEGDSKIQKSVPYPVNVIADLPPVVEIKKPESIENSVPANRTLAIEIEASDPDYEIFEVYLLLNGPVGDRDQRNRLDLVSFSDNSRVSARYVFDPQALRLKVNDEVTFFARARDNRQSVASDAIDSNISTTAEYKIKITAPEVSAGNDQSSDPNNNSNDRQPQNNDKTNQQEEKRNSDNQQEKSSQEKGNEGDNNSGNKGASDKSESRSDSENKGEQNKDNSKGQGSESKSGGGSDSDQRKSGGEQKSENAGSKGNQQSQESGTEGNPKNQDQKSGDKQDQENQGGQSGSKGNQQSQESGADGNPKNQDQKSGDDQNQENQGGQSASGTNSGGSNSAQQSNESAQSNDKSNKPPQSNDQGQSDSKNNGQKGSSGQSGNSSGNQQDAGSSADTNNNDPSNNDKTSDPENSANNSAKGNSSDKSGRSANQNPVGDNAATAEQNSSTDNSLDQRRDPGSNASPGSDQQSGPEGSAAGEDDQSQPLGRETHPGERIEKLNQLIEELRKKDSENSSTSGSQQNDQSENREGNAEGKGEQKRDDQTGGNQSDKPEQNRGAGGNSDNKSAPPADQKDQETGSDSKGTGQSSSDTDKDKSDKLSKKNGSNVQKQGSGSDQQEKEKSDGAGSAGSEQNDRDKETDPTKPQTENQSSGQTTDDAKDDANTSDANKPDADKPGTDKPGTDKSGTDKSGTDKSGTDKSDTDKPAEGQGTTDPSGKNESGKEKQDSNTAKDTTNKQIQPDKDGPEKNPAQQQSGSGKDKPNDSAQNEDGNKQSENNQTGNTDKQDDSDPSSSNQNESSTQQGKPEKSDGNQPSNKAQNPGNSNPSEKDNSAAQSSTESQNPTEQDQADKSDQRSDKNNSRQRTDDSNRAGDFSDRHAPKPGSLRGESAEAEKANLEYAKKATDLALKFLDEQKDNPDEELLRQMNWTPEELREFVDRWKTMKEKAESGGEAEKRQFTEALKSLGLRPPKNAVTGAEIKDDQQRGMLEDGAVSKPPADIAKKFRAFQRGRARANEDRQ